MEDLLTVKTRHGPANLRILSTRFKIKGGACDSRSRITGISLSLRCWVLELSLRRVMPEADLLLVHCGEDVRLLPVQTKGTRRRRRRRRRRKWRLKWDPDPLINRRRCLMECQGKMLDG